MRKGPRMNWHDQARNLVANLRRRGISDEQVLERIASVPRHWFVPDEQESLAWEDVALPLACGQTISQPYIVALMTAAAELSPTDHVLEVGTGSGYQAAILAGLCARLVTIECLESLASEARSRWERLQLGNILSVVGDGSAGWVDEAPYQAILVTAGAPQVPQPLVQQLAPGGRLVIPVGPEEAQELLVLRREDNHLVTRKLCDCRFVKMYGRFGWPAESAPTDVDTPT